MSVSHQGSADSADSADPDALTGLTRVEVEQRISAGEVNNAPDAKSRSLSSIIKENTLTWFNFLIGSMWIVMLIVAPWQDSLFGFVIIANALIGTIQEYRAARTLEKLAVIGESKPIVRRDGQVLKRIQRNSARTNTAVRQPTLSSRSVPKPAPKAAVRATPKATAAQVIQVGTYGSQSNAQTVAKKLQRMGLPVRIGKYTRGAQTYRMVLVGPFGRDAAQHLNAVRRAGYSDAFLRN